jgi:hypothetical protein
MIKEVEALIQGGLYQLFRVGLGTVLSLIQPTAITGTCKPDLPKLIVFI